MSHFYNINLENEVSLDSLKKYLKHVDSDYGYSVALKITEFKSTERGFRIAGTDAEEKAGLWIAGEMKRIGLQDVTIREFPVDCWDFRGAYVNVNMPKIEQPRLFAGSFPGIQGIGNQKIDGEVVYVSEGTKECYQDLEVKDKIVLVDTECYHTYRFDSLFIQAESRGAKAIIATVTDRGPGTYRDDLITIQNLQNHVGIPAVMMTKRDGETLRDILKSEEKLEVSIEMDLTLGKSNAHYVYGTIPGKKSDSFILLCSHYDAYWEGFQDNASSVGSVLTIAKAMIDSGYEPENTFVFISNGAEEFGTKDTRYDFCAGANAIRRDHPEWMQNTILLNNFELSAISDVDHLELNIAPCYTEMFGPLLKKIGYGGEMSYILSKGVGADDGVFSKQGVPTYMNVCTHFSDSDMGESLGQDAMENFDHTQYDDRKTYNPEVFDFNNRLNGMINLAVDSMPFVPADYSGEMQMFIDSLPAQEITDSCQEWKDLRELAELVRDKSGFLYHMTMKINEDALAASGKEQKRPGAVAYNRAMMKINRIIQKKICKFNPFHMFIYGHVQPYAYVSAFAELISGLQKGEASSALEKLFEIDNTYLIAEFDKEVYERIAIQEFNGQRPESWGTGEHLLFPDLYDTVTSIMQKQELQNAGFEDEVRALQEMEKQQQNVLREVIEEETKCLREIVTLLDEAEASFQEEERRTSYDYERYERRNNSARGVL